MLLFVLVALLRRLTTRNQDISALFTTGEFGDIISYAQKRVVLFAFYQEV